MRGTVRWFNNQRGYGFITDSDGKEHFFHYSSIQMDGFRTLDEGDIVEFELGNDTTGREQAVNVHPFLTLAMVKNSLKEEKLLLDTIKDPYGVKKYLVVDAGDVLQTNEQGLSLLEVAAYAGIDVEGLK